MTRRSRSRAKGPAAVFTPIGSVKDGVIQIHRRWAGALAGIEGFSHLIIVSWLDQAAQAGAEASS